MKVYEIRFVNDKHVRLSADKVSFNASSPSHLEVRRENVVIAQFRPDQIIGWWELESNDKSN